MGAILAEHGDEREQLAKGSFIRCYGMMPQQHTGRVKFVVKGRLFILLMLLFGLFSARQAVAIEVNNLYQVDILVSDKGSAEMNQAQTQAFKVVLVRVGGTSAVLENPLIKSQLTKAQDYMLQYGYQESEQTFVSVQFDSERINRLLRQANEGVWGNRRPLVMVWLVEEQAGERHILADSTASELPGLIKQASDERGMPSLLPLMDLDDAMQVSVSDVWGRFQAPLAQASSRYAADAMIVAKLFQAGDAWVLDWQLLTLPDMQPLNDVGQSQLTGTREELMTAMVNQLADDFASKYAVTGGSLASDSITITVVNVEQPDIYVAVMKQLASLTQVSAVELVSLNGARAQFRLGLLGDPTSVLAAIELDEHLVVVAGDDITQESQEYAWLP
ncbi:MULTISPECIES: DUF2066 domain-containing protein [Corallincola]|nr:MULTISPECIES: DUF2066 domain-containing protein [Corallincola]